MIDKDQRKDFEKEVEVSKKQLEHIGKAIDNLYTTDGKLRNNVEKDIKLLSEAIFKIKDNYKDILGEIKVMEERKAELEKGIEKTRNGFLEFSEKYGIKIPKFFKDIYDL